MIYNPNGGSGSGSGGTGLGVSVELNLSDITIYEVATKTLSVPASKQYADIFVLTADLYSALTSYSLDNIVRSDGTDGGTAGYFYKSLAGSNIGNLLSDGTKWATADSSIGIIEINNFDSPNTLSIYHNSQFEVVALSAVSFIATAVDTPISTGQIMLPINTTITIRGRTTVDDIVVFNVQNGIARYVGMSIN